jgi:hypothetical protein
MPIYTYEGDSDIGDTKGQNVDGIWHVVSPKGKKIAEAPVGNTGGGGGY